VDGVHVLCCRSGPDPAVAGPADYAVRMLGPDAVSWVGPRPGKQIDELLSGRVVVIGDDADLAAVALRLLRRELLARVVLGYASGQESPVTELYSLPTGPAAVRLALTGDPDLVPLVRNDVGGVLIGRAVIEPVSGTVYLDETPVLKGEAARLIVYPDPARGLEVIVVRRRILGFKRRPDRRQGRALALGGRPARIVSDGVTFPREMTRWTFYRHTEPLRLVRGVA